MKISCIKIITSVIVLAFALACSNQGGSLELRITEPVLEKTSRAKSQLHKSVVKLSNFKAKFSRSLEITREREWVVFDQIPAGEGFVVTYEGYDADNTRIWFGEKREVTIVKGQVVKVEIDVQDQSIPAVPTSNSGDNPSQTQNSTQTENEDTPQTSPVVIEIRGKVDFGNTTTSAKRSKSGRRQAASGAGKVQLRNIHTGVTYEVVLQSDLSFTAQIPEAVYEIIATSTTGEIVKFIFSDPTIRDVTVDINSTAIAAYIDSLAGSSLAEFDASFLRNMTIMLRDNISQSQTYLSSQSVPQQVRQRVLTMLALTERVTALNRSGQASSLLTNAGIKSQVTKDSIVKDYYTTVVKNIMTRAQVTLFIPGDNGDIEIKNGDNIDTKIKVLISIAPTPPTQNPSTPTQGETPRGTPPNNTTPPSNSPPKETPPGDTPPNSTPPKETSPQNDPPPPRPRDILPPTLTHELSAPANAHGWHRAPFEVRFIAQDAQSEILSVTPKVKVEQEGKDIVIIGYATDAGGNVASLSLTFNLDLTPPKIDLELNPPANDLGWHKEDVQVKVMASDALSGLESQSPTRTISSKGEAQILTFQASDKAGHLSEAKVTLNIDKQAPPAPIFTTVQATTNPQPTWTWRSASSDGIGQFRLWLNNPEGTPILTQKPEYTSTVELGEGTHVLYVQERDRAGNWSEKAVHELRIDRAPPKPPQILTGKLVHDSRPVLAWKGEDERPLTFRYALNAAGDTKVVYVDTHERAFRPQKDLPLGVHVLRVIAIDEAGNVSSPSVHEFEVTSSVASLAQLTSLLVLEDEALSFSFKIEGDPSQFQVMVKSSDQSLIRDSAIVTDIINDTVRVVAQPQKNVSGTLELDVTLLSAGQSQSHKLSVEIFAQNDAPDLPANAFVTRSGESLVVQFSAADVDSDQTDIQYETIVSPKNGKLTGNPPNLVYQPEKDFVGSDSFRIRARDNKGEFSDTTMSIEVFEANLNSPAKPQAAYDPQTSKLKGVLPFWAYYGYWTVLTGDDKIEIVDPSKLETAVKLTTVGTYQVRFTVGNGLYVDHIDVTLSNQQTSMFSEWFPAHGEKVNIDALVIEVQFDDASEVSPSSILMTLDNVEVHPVIEIQGEKGYITYTPSDNLIPGDHEVMVSLRDNSGLFSSTRWSFKVGAAPGPIQHLLVLPGDQQVAMRWREPAGGEKPDGYFLWKNGEKLGEFHQEFSWILCTRIQNLPNDVSARFGVTAFNEFGEGDLVDLEEKPFELKIQILNKGDVVVGHGMKGYWDEMIKNTGLSITQNSEAEKPYVIKGLVNDPRIKLAQSVHNGSKYVNWFVGQVPDENGMYEAHCEIYFEGITNFGWFYGAPVQGTYRTVDLRAERFNPHFPPKYFEKRSSGITITLAADAYSFDGVYGDANFVYDDFEGSAAFSGGYYGFMSIYANPLPTQTAEDFGPTMTLDRSPLFKLEYYSDPYGTFWNLNPANPFEPGYGEFTLTQKTDDDTYRLTVGVDSVPYYSMSLNTDKHVIYEGQSVTKEYYAVLSGSQLYYGRQNEQGIEFRSHFTSNLYRVKNLQWSGSLIGKKDVEIRDFNSGAFIGEKTRVSVLGTETLTQGEYDLHVSGDLVYGSLKKSYEAGGLAFRVLTWMGFGSTNRMFTTVFNPDEPGKTLPLGSGMNLPMEGGSLFLHAPPSGVKVGSVRLKQVAGSGRVMMRETQDPDSKILMHAGSESMNLWPYFGKGWFVGVKPGFVHLQAIYSNSTNTNYTPNNIYLRVENVMTVDCNHDGVIDESDVGCNNVAILEGFGIDNHPKPGERTKMKLSSIWNTGEVVLINRNPHLRIYSKPSGNVLFVGDEITWSATNVPEYVYLEFLKDGHYNLSFRHKSALGWPDGSISIYRLSKGLGKPDELSPSHELIPGMAHADLNRGNLYMGLDAKIFKTRSLAPDMRLSFNQLEGDLHYPFFDYPISKPDLLPEGWRNNYQMQLVELIEDRNKDEQIDNGDRKSGDLLVFIDETGARTLFRYTSGRYLPLSGSKYPQASIDTDFGAWNSEPIRSRGYRLSRMSRESYTFESSAETSLLLGRLKLIERLSGGNIQISSGLVKDNRGRNENPDNYAFSTLLKSSGNLSVQYRGGGAPSPWIFKFEQGLLSELSLKNDFPKSKFERVMTEELVYGFNYDNKYRIKSMKTPYVNDSSDKRYQTSIAYDKEQAVVTQELGGKVTVEFNKTLDFWTRRELDSGISLSEIPKIVVTRTPNENGLRRVASESNGRHQVNMSYDDKGFLKSRSVAGGESRTYLYEDDPTGQVRLLKSESLLGKTTEHKTSYVYYTSGNAVTGMKSMTDPCGNKTSYKYNLLGDLMSKTDRRGHVWKYQSLNDVGQSMLFASPEETGRKESYGYNSIGDITFFSNFQQIFSHKEFDSRFRLIASTPAGQAAVDYRYDERDLVIEESYQNGLIIRHDHDGLGRLVRTRKESKGKKLIGDIVISYETAGGVTTQTTKRELSGGNVEVLSIVERDGWGRVLRSGQERKLKHSDPSTTVWTKHTYTPEGWLSGTSTTIDGKAVVTKIQYDSAGRVESRMEADQNKDSSTRYTYHDEGWLKSLTHPDGRSESYQYDDCGRVIKITGPRGAFEKIEHDPEGNVVKRQRFLSNGNAYTNPQLTKYAEDGLIEDTTDVLGNTKILKHYKEYNKAKLSQMIEGAPGTKIITTYNHRGFASQYKYRGVQDFFPEDPRDVDIETDVFGQITSIKSPYREKVGVEYDALTRQTRSYASSDTNEEISSLMGYHPDTGRVSEQTSPLGLRVESKRDEKTGQLQELSDQFTKNAPMTKVLTRNESGQVRKFEDAKGRTWENQYDLRGRRNKLISPDGVVTTWEYDTSGRLKKRIRGTGADAKVVSIEYSNFGLTSVQSDEEGRKTKREHDDFGRLVKVTKAFDTHEEIVTRYEYNPKTGLLEKEIRESKDGNRTTAYRHNRFGKVVAFKNPKEYAEEPDWNKGTSTVFTYNGLIRLERIEYASDPGAMKAGAQESFFYNSAGDMIGHVDKAGRHTKSELDGRGWVSKKRYFASSGNSPIVGSIAYKRNHAGQVLVEEYTNDNDQSQKIRNQFDKRGRRTFIGHDQEESNVGIVYHPDNSIKDKQTAAGHSTRLYNSSGQLEKVLSQNSHYLQYHYYEDGLHKGRLKSLDLPNGTSRDFLDYDKSGLVLKMRETAANRAIDYNYIYDNHKRLTNILSSSGNIDYLYNSFDQLLSETSDGPNSYKKTYTYDLTNNITSKTTIRDGKTTILNYTYNALNQLIKTEDASPDTGPILVGKTNQKPLPRVRLLATFSYHPSGHIEEEKGPDGKVKRRFEYDRLDRISKMTITDGPVIEYDYYGASWKRRSVTVDGKKTTFSYDGFAAVSQETDGVTTHYNVVNGQPLWETTNGVVKTYGKDTFGNVTRVYGPNKEDQVNLSIDAYGNIETVSGNVDKTHASFIGYRGQVQDYASGDVYLRWRNYDPALGRFRGWDKIGLAGGMNPFAYAGGDPVQMWDPWGTSEFAYNTNREDDHTFIGGDHAGSGQFNFTSTFSVEHHIASEGEVLAAKGLAAAAGLATTAVVAPAALPVLGKAAISTYTTAKVSGAALATKAAVYGTPIVGGAKELVNRMNTQAFNVSYHANNLFNKGGSTVYQFGAKRLSNRGNQITASIAGGTSVVTDLWFGNKNLTQALEGGIETAGAVFLFSPGTLSVFQTRNLAFNEATKWQVMKIKGIEMLRQGLLGSSLTLTIDSVKKRNLESFRDRDTQVKMLSAFLANSALTFLYLQPINAANPIGPLFIQDLSKLQPHKIQPIGVGGSIIATPVENKTIKALE